MIRISLRSTRIFIHLKGWFETLIVSFSSAFLQLKLQIHLSADGCKGTFSLHHRGANLCQMSPKRAVRTGAVMDFYLKSVDSILIVPPLIHPSRLETR